MKNLSFTILFCVIVFCGHSQDIIKTISSSEIKAKVIEINETTVKYKKYDYQDGPTFSMQKSEIVSITYQNGVIDVFQTPTTNPVTTYTNQITSSSENTSLSSLFKSHEKEAPKQKERKFNDVKRFFIYLGASFPIGRCTKMEEGKYITPLWTDVDNYGGAQIGFNFGIKGRIPVSKHMGITISGDLFFNSIKESAFTEKNDVISYLCDELNYEYGTNAYDYRLNTQSKYLNIPIMLGLNFTHMFNPKIGLSIEGSLGADFDFITPTIYRNNFAGTFTHSEYNAYTNTRINYYSAEKLKFVYIPAVHFAFQGSFSLIFAKRWSVGVYYFGTTKSNIKFEMKETSKSYKMDKSNNLREYCQKLAFNMLMLKIGVGF